MKRHFRLLFGLAVATFVAGLLLFSLLNWPFSRQADKQPQTDFNSQLKSGKIAIPKEQAGKQMEIEPLTKLKSSEIFVRKEGAAELIKSA